MPDSAAQPCSAGSPTAPGRQARVCHVGEIEQIARRVESREQGCAQRGSRTSPCAAGPARRRTSLSLHEYLSYPPVPRRSGRDGQAAAPMKARRRLSSFPWRGTMLGCNWGCMRPISKRESACPPPSLHSGLAHCSRNWRGRQTAAALKAFAADKDVPKARLPPRPATEGTAPRATCPRSMPVAARSRREDPVDSPFAAGMGCMI